MVLTVLIVLSAAGLAWANGANDVSKGVATLVGSRVATYTEALRWGTFWTVAGAIAALMVTTAMLKTFSTGLVLGPVAHSAAFPFAAASGALVWVLIASQAGWPVSTTHALAGGIIGGALAAGGAGGIRWTLAAESIGAPLAFSPIAAGAIAYVLHGIAYRRLSTAARYCICARERPIVASDASLGGFATARAVMLPVVIVDQAQACADGGTLQAGVRVTDAGQWVTSAAISFARGLNDTPKILALAVAAGASVGIGVTWLFGACALIMGAGSMVAGRRVTRTLAERVTQIDPLEGLAASAVAAALVLASSIVALPVSTTHVASGAIIGAGLRSGSHAVHWRTVSGIVLAWFVTLPISALAAAIVWLVIAR